MYISCDNHVIMVAKIFARRILEKVQVLAGNEIS